MRPIKSEASEDVCSFFLTEIPAEVREQVQFVASDQPAGVLMDRLKDVLPNLRAVYLDEVHLCIVWQVAFWRKSSPGQRALRRVQAKFNKVDYATPLAQWGPLFEGKEPVPYSDAEEEMRDLIMSGGMSTHRAASVLNNLHDDKPWHPQIRRIVLIYVS